MVEKLDGQRLAELTGSSLNHFGFDDTIKDFTVTMSFEHRTLQQAFTKLCIAWLKHLSEREHWDLRNESSVTMAKDVMELIQEKNHYLPFI